MLDITNKSECCGCFACKNVCPVNAISMVEDEKGFKYPQINYSLCINCDLCKNVCPIINTSKEEVRKVEAYACINLDNEIRMQSSSGGVFSIIAENIINSGGVVFGAVFNEKFEVEHREIEKVKDIGALRKSKYMQSDINLTYKKVEKFLKDERTVLFTGTPCQIEGLKSYLRKDYEKLYTQDIICHGVPSKKVWREYLKYKEKLAGEKPEEISFRDKKNNGWSKYEVLFRYKNKSVSTIHSEDIFMRIFLKDLALRDSCYDCKFKKQYRNSDITLADFWGINNVIPEMNDEKGTSLVIVNSKKGKELFNTIKSKIAYKNVNFEEAIKYNPSMTKSSKINPNSKDFFDELNSGEALEDLIKKYVD